MAWCRGVMGVPIALALVAGAALTPWLCLGDVDPVSGIDFVRVGAVGNAPWAGDGTAGDRAVGRGQVNYEYNIGKYEVTSAQWAEFFSAAFDRAPGDTIPHLVPPTFWGGIPTTPTHTENPRAMRWTTTPQSAMLPTGNISWRVAAIYCNWLCNGKSSERSAFLSGAYDVSTFGYQGSSGIFTDQLTHNPGAAYYIPTWDEHLKASHYDPAKINTDGSVGGWWRYNTTSDTPPVYAPPGVFVNGQLGQANANWDNEFPGYSPFSTPLGAYSNVTSPWWLFDTAGGTREWTELTNFVGGQWPIGRGFEGTAWVFGTYGGALDRVSDTGGDFPSLSTFDLGFRIAATVPAPSVCLPGVGLVVVAGVRRRRG